MEDEPFPEPVPLPITGELDLHTFKPGDLSELLPEYFRLCRERGLLRIRVIHGKGTGQLRQGVIALLRQLPEVDGYSPAGEQEGGWGATLVFLKPIPRAPVHPPSTDSLSSDSKESR